MPNDLRRKPRLRRAGGKSRAHSLQPGSDLDFIRAGKLPHRRRWPSLGKDVLLHHKTEAVSQFHVWRSPGSQPRRLPNLQHNTPDSVYDEARGSQGQTALPCLRSMGNGTPDRRPGGTTAHLFPYPTGEARTCTHFPSSKTQLPISLPGSRF